MFFSFGLFANGERGGHFVHSSSKTLTLTEDADSNPFKGVNVGSRSNIAFFDANGDGIMDARLLAI